MVGLEADLQQITDSPQMTSSGSINMEMPLSTCVASVVANIALGRRYRYGDPKFQHYYDLNKQMFALFGDPCFMIMTMYPWHIRGHMGYDAMADLLAQFQEYFTEQIREHKKTLDLTSEPEDVTAAYLAEMKRRADSGEDSGSFRWTGICIFGDKNLLQ